jgi:hypothetical protein
MTFPAFLQDAAPVGDIPRNRHFSKNQISY